MGGWFASTAYAVAVATVYHLVARLSLSGLFFYQSEGVTVFWAAAGISSGLLIGFGRRARGPVIVGVFVGAFLIPFVVLERGIWLSAIFAACDVVEPIIIAGLIARYFGDDFALDQLRKVFSFLGATIAGTIPSSLGGAVASRLFLGPETGILTTWLHWWTGVAVGVVTVAPVIIGFSAALHGPPPRKERIEGSAGLLTLAAMTGVVLALPQQLWETVVPGALLLPILLWLAARCSPVFAAAGVLIVSLTIAWTTIFNIGHFANTGLTVDYRIVQAQAVILAAAIGAQVLAALFAERRVAEEQFHLAIEAAPNGMVMADSEGRIVLVNCQAEIMFGYRRDELIGHKIEMLLPERFRANHSILRTDYAARPTARPMGIGRDLYALRKDGTEVPLEIGLSPIVTGQGMMILSAVVDIAERKQAEARIASDLRDMTRLNELSNKFVRQGAEIDEILTAVVETAIALAGADKGNLQLFNSETGTLTIAAQRGFEAPFLKFFEYVRDDASACAAAMRSGERVIVEDVASSEIFAGQPSEYVLMDAGVRAVISTPLMSSTGNLLGMISTHFAKPCRPDERELRLIDLLARQTADYLERKHAEELQDTLVREIQHRSGNLLAVIQAVASRSLSGNFTLAEAKAAFEARLQALARANRQLTGSNWTSVDLNEIVRLELQPFSERTIIEGVNVSLGPRQAQDLALGLHELATNAAKYGALSNGTGKVEISWALTGPGKAPALKFKWRERGGPAVAVPTRRGFGTTLLKATFPDARFDYANEGLSCELEVALGGGDLIQTEAG